MSQSWWNKRYRTPDPEIQRINNILHKQALERAQQEKPTSALQLISVAEESFLGLADRFKAKAWLRSDITNFKFTQEPDRKTLMCGADFNAGVIVDDTAFMGNKIHIIGDPLKVDGLEDGENMHVPIDLQFNGKSQYIRIEDNPSIRIKEIMESPPAGVDGITLIFRISPLVLGIDEDQFLLSKWDNNSITYGMQIKIKPNGEIHWHVMRNGTVRGVYANNQFTLIPPPAGNYYYSQFLAENYLVVAANKVVLGDHTFFFQYKFSDNTMRILKGNAVNVTVGTSLDAMTKPVPIAEPPSVIAPVATKIPVLSASASGEDSGHPVTHAFDNNLSTYWAHSSRTAHIIADLGVPQRITAVEIAWKDGDTKRYYYDIFTGSQPDISKMNRVTPNTILSSGTTTSRQRYTFPSERYARYVLLLGQGNQGNPTPSPPVSQWLNLTAMTVTAKGEETPNVKTNIRDGNLNTRWAHKGRGSWIQIDLGSTKVITRMAIAWYSSHLRRYRYNVEVSITGAEGSYKQAWPFNGLVNDLSDIQPNDKDYDHVPFEVPMSARYIRINIWGNTTNDWNNIWEIRVRALEPGGTSEPQSLVAISEFDIYGFPAETVTDPFNIVYNNPNTAPNTDEYFVRLHGPGISNEFVNVYSVTSITHQDRKLGEAFNRFSRGERVKQGSSLNSPFYNETLTRVSCFAKRVGNPSGDLEGYIWNGDEERFYFGAIPCSSIPTDVFKEIIFTNANSTYKVGEGDIVAFDYYLGDASNYLLIGIHEPSEIPDSVSTFYSDTWHDVDNEELCGKFYKLATNTHVGNTIAAQEIADTTSGMYGNVLTKFTFYLRKKGNPIGTILFKLLNAQNNDVYIIGSVEVASITSSTTSLTAITVDYSALASVQSLVGFKIAIEYEGGNPDEYIMVKLYNDGSSSSHLAVKNTNGTWRIDPSKDLAGIFYKGGKTRVLGGSPIPATPLPLNNYSHDMFLLVAGEENTLHRIFAMALRGFYNGNMNRFRYYRRYLTDSQMTNFNTNKKSISDIPYGKIFSPLTFTDTSIEVIGEGGGAGAAVFSGAFTSAFNTGTP
jgi:hypothetical protein